MEQSRKDMNSRVLVLVISFVIAIASLELYTNLQGISTLLSTIMAIIFIAAAITVLISGFKFSTAIMKVETKPFKTISIIVLAFLLILLILWIMYSFGYTIMLLGLNYFLSFLILLGLFFLYSIILYFTKFKAAFP